MRKEDQEWNEISKDFPLNDKANGKKRYTRDDYLNDMKEIIIKIRNHPYINEQSEENKKDIVKLLYNISSMFFGFPHRINAIYKENGEDKWEPPFDICGHGFGLPTSHGFCANLSLLTLELLEKYYFKQLECIEYFIDTKGKLPRYLYGLRKNYVHPNYQFFVETLEYITERDKEKDIIYVPDYFHKSEKQII